MGGDILRGTAAHVALLRKNCQPSVSNSSCLLTQLGAEDNQSPECEVRQRSVSVSEYLHMLYEMQASIHIGSLPTTRLYSFKLHKQCGAVSTCSYHFQLVCPIYTCFPCHSALYLNLSATISCSLLPTSVAPALVFGCTLYDGSPVQLIVDMILEA